MKGGFTSNDFWLYSDSNLTLFVHEYIQHISFLVFFKTSNKTCSIYCVYAPLKV